jgi:hypothetical protein
MSTKEEGFNGNHGTPPGSATENASKSTEPLITVDLPNGRAGFSPVIRVALIIPQSKEYLVIFILPTTLKGIQSPQSDFWVVFHLPIML